MEKFKFLIIGGAGAIGSYLSRELVKMNHDITVLDNLSSGHLELLDNEKVTFIHHDIIKPIEFDNKYDVIIHAAAFFANQNSVDNPIDDLITNGIGTLNTLEFAKRNKQLRKFIYLSSSCVYGNNYNQSELASIGLLDTPYAITKYLGEKYCEYYNHHFNIPISILRLFNAFGPGEYPGKYRNVIPNFIRDIILQNKIQITGSGEETRDFTSYKDILQAIVLNITHLSNFDIFNVGTGKDTSINSIALILKNLSPKEFVIEYIPRRDWDSVTKRVAKIDKIKEILKYSPTTDLNNDIQETFEFISNLIDQPTSIKET